MPRCRRPDARRRERPRRPAGGGIFTEAFEDYGALTLEDYQNIHTYQDTYFVDNSAVIAYEPPTIAASYTNFIYESSSIVDTDSDEYIHPINNFDINYVGLTPIPGTESYFVTYNGNGGSGSMTDINSPYRANEAVDILKNAFKKQLYVYWV